MQSCIINIFCFGRKNTSTVWVSFVNTWAGSWTHRLHKAYLQIHSNNTQAAYECHWSCRDIAVVCLFVHSFIHSSITHLLVHSLLLWFVHLFTGPDSSSCPRSVLSLLFLYFLSLSFFQILFIQLFYPKIWVLYMGTCNPSCQHAVRWHPQWTIHSLRDTFLTKPKINVHAYVCNKQPFSFRPLPSHPYLHVLAIRQLRVCVCVCVCVWERERERERCSVRMNTVASICMNIYVSKVLSASHANSLVINSSGHIMLSFPQTATVLSY